MDINSNNGIGKTKNIYRGIPDQLKVFRVPREKRINPLSFEPGGCDVVVEYHNFKLYDSNVLLYDWIKYPGEYIAKIFDNELKVLEQEQHLDFIKQKLKRIFIKYFESEAERQIKEFQEIWNYKTSESLPWQILDNFEKENFQHQNYKDKESSDESHGSICQTKEESAREIKDKHLINKTDILEVIKFMNFENNTLEELIEDYDGLLILSNKAYRNYKKGNIGEKFRTLLENNKILVQKYEPPSIIKNNSNQYIFQSGIFLNDITKWSCEWPDFTLLFYFEINQRTLSFETRRYNIEDIEDSQFNKWKNNIEEVLKTASSKIINNEFKYNKIKEIDEEQDSIDTTWTPQSGKGYAFYESFSLISYDSLSIVGLDKTQLKNNLFKDFEDIYFLHIATNSISYILIEFLIDNDFGKKVTIKEINGEISLKLLKNFEEI